MYDFLTSARRFADEAPVRINLIDLGLALYLEYFSWPLLRFLPYVRLAKRVLLPTMEMELCRWLSVEASEQDIPARSADPDVLMRWAMQTVTDHADQHEILVLIGRGLHQRGLIRRQQMVQANRVSKFALGGAILSHLLMICGIVLAPIGLIVGWFSGLAFATFVCQSNRHWTTPCRISEST